MDSSPPGPAASWPRHWAAHSVFLRRELGRILGPASLKSVHALTPWRHMAVAVCLTALTGALGWAQLRLTDPLLWMPLSLLMGLALFDFTVLLHEAIHGLVWPGAAARRHALLAALYAAPTGISPTQFKRWHLDHHTELGSDVRDPKRHRLSPRRNARWLKLLYFTPALFFIYFRAAAREAAAYPPEVRSTIGRERILTLLLHGTAAAGICAAWGGAALLRLYLVPYFVGFPLAFGLNRMGQHYAIDPADPARWGTRIRRSLLWEAAFLWSGYHLEHHYYPGVPFYRLRRLNRLLTPFFLRRGIPERSYVWLAWQYLVKNRVPHTRWD